MDTTVLWILFPVLSSFAFAINLRKPQIDKIRSQSRNVDRSSNFRRLQYRFFGPYFLAIFGDWLQGPYVYQLYKSYGFPEYRIAILFLAGFGSSSTFGTFTGPLTDKYGRKRMAMVFCVIYGLCCVIKLSREFEILLAGRILAGVATSLLFSVFESWYVKEHKLSGFDDEWMAETFSTSTFANGVIAIVAGMVANFSADTLGHGPIGPFIIGSVTFAVCFIVIALTWTENYGDPGGELIRSYKDGLMVIWNDKRIFFLGMMQSIVESCMYIFVFLWTPVLSDPTKTPPPPLGLIFSCFMVCIMIGSNIFSRLLETGSWNEADTLSSAIVLFASSTGVCSFVSSGNRSRIIGNLFDVRFVSLAAFLALETSIGIYFPSIGCLRSKLIPETHRATVTNWFRVPMNLITCVTLLTVNHPTLSQDKRGIFAVCTALLISGSIVANKFKKAYIEKKKTY